MTHLTSTSSQSPWTQPHPKLEGISMMDHLYNRLDGMYPNRWRSSFSTESAIQGWRDAWSEAFIEEGLTPIEVKTGLSNCRRMFDWPPSLTEFMKACRMNLAPETAFHEAVRGMAARSAGEMGVWTHPAIFWAAVRVTSYELLNGNYQGLKARWENALRDVLAAGKWQEIPEAHLALPAPSNSPADRAEARKRMAELGASGVLNQGGKDHKRWAPRILERAKSGNPPSPAVIEMARRAMGEAA